MDRRVELVEVEFPDGEIGYARVEVPLGGDVGAYDRYRLSQVGPQIRRVTRWLLDEVREAVPGRPDKVGLEFGVKFCAKSGKLVSAIAEASGEASVVIKLEWTPGPEKPA